MRGASHELTSMVVFTVAYNPNAASKGGVERGCARAGRVFVSSVAAECGRKCDRSVRPQIPHTLSLQGATAAEREA
jgi:hypothetical protein